MEQIGKIKVVMVCHISNPRIREHLTLDYGNKTNVIRKLFGVKTRDGGYNDIASWNTDLANYFSKRKDVDFTIVSPHPGMKKFRVAYTDQNVNYVFLDTKWSGVVKRFVKRKGLWKKINPFAKEVKKEVKRINPDLVVLMGTENSYYSCTILGIKDYPVYVMCQTVYNNPLRKKYGNWDEEKAETELNLFEEFKYFGVYCNLHYEMVSKYSPKSYIFKFDYPRKDYLLKPVVTKKEYDFINFAVMMDSRKGFPDALQALAIVKRQYPQVKLNLIGSCTVEKKKEYVELINKFGLQDNVVFTPFFERQSDLFLHVQKSRFAVLPCKMDNISGTMMQAMQLGLPIVVYRTTGTPSFNKEKRCALIAEKDNVEELAQHMLSLMSDPVLAQSLRENGREWQEKRYEAGLHNGDHIVDNFKAIIGHFRNGTPIPQEQLFTPDIDD